MDLSFISEMFIPIAVGGCLAAGYVLKMWFPCDNRLIPTILTGLGIIIACVAARTVTLELIVAGALSGLASTGLHQAFVQLLNLNSENRKCKRNNEKK